MDQAIARGLAASRVRADRSAELVHRHGPITSVDDRQQGQQSLVDSPVDSLRSSSLETRQANGRGHSHDHSELLASEVHRLAALSQQDQCTTIPTLCSSGARVKFALDLSNIHG